MLILLLVLLL